MGNFEGVLKTIWEKENHLDHQDRFSPSSLVTFLLNENSLLRVYTFEAFADFQWQVSSRTLYVLRSVTKIEFEVIESILV